MRISPVNYAALSYSFLSVVTILFEYTFRRCFQISIHFPVSTLATRKVHCYMMFFKKISRGRKNPNTQQITLRPEFEKNPLNKKTVIS